MTHHENTQDETAPLARSLDALGAAERAAAPDGLEARIVATTLAADPVVARIGAGGSRWGAWGMRAAAGVALAGAAALMVWFATPARMSAADEAPIELALAAWNSASSDAWFENEELLAADAALRTIERSAWGDGWADEASFIETSDEFDIERGGS